MPKSQFTQLLDKLIHWQVTTLAFLLPLFFLPITTEFYDFNKKALLFLLTSIIVLSWILHHILTRSVRLTLTPPLLPLSLLTVVSLASLLIHSPNRLQAFIDRPLIYLCLTLIYLIITTHLKQSRQVRRIASALIISASVLGLISILKFLPPLNHLAFLPSWFKNPTFTPSGSPLTALLFLAPTFILSLLNLIPKRQPTPNKTVYLLASILILSGLVLNIILVSNPENKTVLLPLGISWELAAGNITAPLPALLGVGPEGFIDTFTSHKPISFNRTPDWNLRFTSASNEPLHLFATLGLLGLAAHLWLLFLCFKSAHQVFLDNSLNPSEKTVTMALLATIILQFIFPQSSLSLTLFVLLLALQQTLRKLETDTQVRDVILRLFAISLVKPEDSPSPTSREEILPWVLGIPLSLTLLAGLYLGATSVYAAEGLFKQSLDAAAGNRGTDTYNLQIKAIQKNPKEDRYRIAYALTNLALANSLAQRPNLSQADRQNITQLIQQSIREAKIATSLNPHRTANWETLATVYRNLINVAQGAKEWAIASYVEAIKTDPNNPRLRLELGGIYFGTSDFDQAIRFFGQAALLKPDWANAHYNLSAAYREKGDIDKAIEEMKLVLQTLDPQAADYPKAQSELQFLNTQLGKATPTSDQQPTTSSQLSEPSPLPSPKPPAEQLKLPPESAPNVATGAAVPTPKVSPTP